MIEYKARVESYDQVNYFNWIKKLTEQKYFVKKKNIKIIYYVTNTTNTTIENYRDV